jgi:hypothetical protein
MRVYVWVQTAEPDAMDGGRVHFIKAFRLREKAEKTIRMQTEKVQAESELFECEVEF